jgi:hypothetical protein
VDFRRHAYQLSHAGVSGGESGLAALRKILINEHLGELLRDQCGALLLGDDSATVGQTFSRLPFLPACRPCAPSAICSGG